MRQFQKQIVPGRAVHRLVRWIWKEINRQCVSQEDVAKRAGLASSTFRKWRNGVRSPRLMEIEAICNALGKELVLKDIEDPTPEDILVTVRWMQRVARTHEGMEMKRAA